MKNRILSHTDLDLGVIGMGCMGLSHAYGPALPEEQAVEVVRAAYEMGYRFFDTAAVYRGVDPQGRLSSNEKIVGKALHDVRSQVIIASKYGVKHGETGLITNGSIENLRKSLDQTLKDLNTDYLDLFYLHRIDPDVPVEKVAEEMKRQIEAGRIRGWGLSEASEEQIRKANAVCPLSAVQNRFSMMARWNEPIIRLCEEQGITFVAFSPLANGAMSGQYREADFKKDGDFRADMPQFSKDGRDASRQLMDQLEEIAETHGCSLAQLSLAWMCTLSDQLIPIPGSTKSYRLQENFDAQNVKLTEQDMKRINDILEKIPQIPVYGGKVIES